ncbi:MAG TPA: TonB family protein [Vicinamibacterales bacterium]|nr:TonB family protein [Vicinamibacterales bacterium]
MKRSWVVVGWMFVTLPFGLAPASAQEQFKIIVNVANPVVTLSKSDIADLFLGKRNEWTDGAHVMPVEAAEVSDVREAFVRDMLGVSRTTAKRQREKTGVPVSVATDREVLAYVRLKAGAIGYVSGSTHASGVKVLKVRGVASLDDAESPPPARVFGVKMPAKIVDVPPGYPPRAKALRIQGSVEVDIVIGADGAVDDARIVKSSPWFDEEALTAVRQWRYEPTVVNGVAIPVRMVVRVGFVL